MADAITSLSQLENAVQRFDQVLTVMVVLFAMNVGGKAAYEGLMAVENSVNAIDDKQLTSSFHKALDAYRDPTPRHEYIQNEDYKAFMGRLNSLMVQSAVDVNETDITMREAVGANAAEGMWGPKGWRPTGKLV